MRLLAALSAAVAVFLAVAELTGAGLRPRRRMPRRVHGPSLAEWLAQAGSTATAPQLWTATVAATLMVAAALLVITGTLVVALPPAIAVGAVPWFHLAAQRHRRLRERVAAWPDALRTLVAELDGGRSLHEALMDLSRRGPVALRPVFARYAAIVPTVDQQAALEAVRSEMVEPVTDCVVEVLAMTLTAGSSTARVVLQELAAHVTEEIQSLERATTLSLEQRLSARAVLVLPYLVLVLLCFQSADYRDFYRTPAGILVALVGGLVSLGGMVTVARLGRPPLTERMFLGQGTGP